MKRKSLTLATRIAATIGLVLSLLFGAPPGVASAHELNEDNGIAGVLHIPPDDNPRAGQPTELDITFGDQNKLFSLQDCTCEVVVKQAATLLQTALAQPVVEGASLASAVTVTFPTPGSYDVVVSGSSKKGTFHNFSFDFLVRVSNGANQTSAPTNKLGRDVVIIGLGSLIILAMFAYIYIKHGKRYASPPKPRNKE